METTDKIFKLNELINSLEIALTNFQNIPDTTWTTSIANKISIAINEAIDTKTALEATLVPTYTKGEAPRQVINGILFSTTSGGAQVQIDNVSGTDIEFTDPVSNITQYIIGPNYKIINSDVYRLIFKVNGITTEVKIVQ